MSTPSTSNFGFLIYGIGRLFIKRFQVEAEHLGISLADARVLTNLSRNPSISQAQLAELSGLEPMTIVRILDRMEADKWIERRPHPTDRRARQLHLGVGAQTALEHIFKISAQLRSEALAGLNAEERAILMDLLERVHEQLLQSVSEQNGKASQRDGAQWPDPGAARKRDERKETRSSLRAASSRTSKTQRAQR